MISGVIAQLIPWDALAWLAGGLAALLGAWIAGRRSGAVRADLRAHKAEDAKHDRINKADLGVGATDADRIDRLREFADRHRN